MVARIERIIPRNLLPIARLFPVLSQINSKYLRMYKFKLSVFSNTEKKKKRLTSI